MHILMGAKIHYIFGKVAFQMLRFTFGYIFNFIVCKSLSLPTFTK